MVFCVSKFQKNGRICSFYWTFGSKKCFSFRGLRPPDPPTRGSAPGPRWRLRPQTSLIGSRSVRSPWPLLDCGPPAGGKLTKWPAVSKKLDSTDLGGRHLDCENLRLMLKISYADRYGLSWGILWQFTFKMCVAAKNCEKFTKNPSFADSRSSMLINLRSLSVMLVMISSMSVPICNRFHTKRVNSGKITSFYGYPFLMPSFFSKGIFAPRSTKFGPKN